MTVMKNPTRGSSLTAIILLEDTHLGSTHQHPGATLHKATPHLEGTLHTRGAIPPLATHPLAILPIKEEAILLPVTPVSIMQVLYLDFSYLFFACDMLKEKA